MVYNFLLFVNLYSETTPIIKDIFIIVHVVVNLT